MKARVVVRPWWCPVCGRRLEVRGVGVSGRLLWRCRWCAEKHGGHGDESDEEKGGQVVTHPRVRTQ
jgi:hypothetical protein